MTDSQDYRKYLDERFDSITTLMNARFNVVDDDNKQINDHLKELNGTVAAHEKTINQNIPHTIAHCSQADTIRKLEENMITSTAVKKFIGWAIGIIVSVITILWGIQEIFFK